MSVINFKKKGKRETGEGTTKLGCSCYNVIITNNLFDGQLIIKNSKMSLIYLKYWNL